MNRTTTWWTAAALAVALACSSEPRASDDGDESAREHPPVAQLPIPAPQPALPAPSDPSPAPSPPALQIVSAHDGELRIWSEDTGLVSLDAGTRILDVAWLGCGDRIAALTGRGRVRVLARAGESLGEHGVPDPRRVHRAHLGERAARVYLGDREPEEGELEEPLAAIEALRESDPSLRTLLRTGPLVRRDDGRLVMVPRLNVEVFTNEESGCSVLADSLEVRIPGVEPAPCPSAPLSRLTLPTGAGDAPPPGWSCDALDPAAPASEGSAQGAWRTVQERSRLVRREAELGWVYHHGTEIDRVIVCREDARPSRQVVLTRFPDAMGCASEAALFVVDGASLLAEAGSDGRVVEHGRVRLYGGTRRWYVELDGGELVELGRVEPDLVVGPRP